MEVTESLEAEVIRLEEIIRLHEVLQQRQFAALEKLRLCKIFEEKLPKNRGVQIVALQKNVTL